MPTTPWDPMRNNNKKLQNESTAFPGITKDAEAKILATAEKQGKTQYERNLIANDLYKVALKEQNNLNFINERTGAKQELYQKSLQSKDKNQSNRLRTTERTAEVADMIRNYSKTNGYGDLDQWEDIDIINGFTNENKATRNEIEDYINGEESAFSFSNRMGFGAGDNRSRFDMITRNGGEWNDDILGHFETESYDNADNKVGTWFKNLGKSTYNLASDLTNMVVNPVDTIGNLTKAAVGGVMNLTGLDDNVGDEGWFAEANQVADGMGDFLKDRYGGKEQILNTFYQDPAGLISDIASIVAGGAGLAKGGATAVAKTAATTGAKSVARNAGKVANVAGKVMRTANNLDPATMILKGEGKIAGGAYKGAKGVVNAVTSPIETGKKILNSAGEGLDKIGEYGAKKITGTTSAQDKLYKAQEPRMNILTRKKDLEKRRANSDRANELIVEYGYKPTDTASRLTAHEATMKKIWNEIEKRVNNDKAVGINQSQLAEKLYDYIKDQKKLGTSLNKADIAALEREMKELNGKIIDLPTLEKKKQVYNSIINNWGEEKVSDVFSNGLKVLTHEIGKIEDSILAEMPGEFQKLKNDFGALKDTYEDVFKADMKNQRKKGKSLIETYSRIEGIGDTLGGIVKLFGGDVSGLAKGLGKLALGKSLAKARDVDFLVKEGFEDLYNSRKGLTENQVSSKTAKYQIAEPTTSKEFKNWFGDWENDPKKASKVVDSEGNPLRVYHGTDNGFNTFTRGGGEHGKGYYFTEDLDYAEEFAGKEGNVMETYLDIKNPLEKNVDLNNPSMKKLINGIGEKYGLSREEIIECFKNGNEDRSSELSSKVAEKMGYGKKDVEEIVGWDFDDIDEIGETDYKAYLGSYAWDNGLNDLVRDSGFDGIISRVYNSDANGYEYIAFEPTQIKSATDNIGTFDKNNPDIRYQKYGTAGSNEKEINATKGLNIRNFKNGKTVQQLADQYGIKTKIVDKISTPEGQKAYGVYGDRMITLAKDLVESTVPHELLHATFDMVDTAKRKSLLDGIQKRLNVDDVQAEEWLADRFSEYYRKGVFDAKNVPNTLVGQIKEFFKQVKEYIDGTYANRKEIQRLFDDIIDGKLEGEYGVYSDPKFQSVYHGSHADFDRFDSSHMGEGEGAQAHGWGHYVAVDKKTAERYAEIGAVKYKGKQVGGYDNLTSNLDNVSTDERSMVQSIAKIMQKEKKTVKEAKAEVLNRWEGYLKEDESRLQKAKQKGNDNDVKEIQKFVDRDKNLIDTIKNINEKDFNYRNLYTNEIPDPVKADTPTGSNYLEEDGKITKEQMNKIYNEVVKEFEKKKEGKAKRVQNLQDGQLRVFKNLIEQAPGMLSDGKGLYTTLSNVLGGQKQASKFLESLGYDGIHYFGGRDGEAYVIFNDDALKINRHEKY